ncbi:hypothetical protein BAE44_0025808 [Dichanthelium oligosanthes]|uniref:Meiosis 5 n=1 Tax=Dichanthelium oligosanthes TaxID=888268 RepID=A0A1E5UJV5_9POAL|nr:hypothetical protein BAE44_0025808 [Dichanthelium oligosanthes]
MEARTLLASFVLAALAAQAFIGVVESRTSPMEKESQGDVKKPDCVPGVDPHSFPGIGGHGGGITPVPSHGGSSGTLPSPSHSGGYTPTPSHGGSSGTLPSPSHGGFGSSPTSPSTGGGYGGSPSTPSHGGAYGSSPSTGGGYGGSPSTPGGAYGGGSSPSPSHGGAYGGSPTPSYGDSPSHGIGTSSPTPFVPVDPHSLGSLPGSCDYWSSHPMEIWSALGGRFPSSMGHFFGAAGSVGGADVSIQDALANTRSDGTGALLREGAAALLNSMTRAGFPYTTEQVRDAFAAAATGGSDSAAAAQAAAFKKANEGKA